MRQASVFRRHQVFVPRTVLRGTGRCRRDHQSTCYKYALTKKSNNNRVSTTNKNQHLCPSSAGLLIDHAWHTARKQTTAVCIGRITTFKLGHAAAV
mmetsp:Transcript_21391/g.40021  ORF Transcript_21391/g.40021 Transcript_21391/m.40021 type:complete len:96 (-) Transcript_21391:365-652(-)